MSWILLTWVVSIVAVVFATTIAYYKRCFSYWQKKNIVTLSVKIPLGNTQNPFNRKFTIYEYIKCLYDEFKRNGAKHGGIYVLATPVYLPTDLDYIKNIMTRDFAHFVDRGMYHNEKLDPLSANLISLEGEKWKTLRAKLSPTFTPGKMKTMFHIVVDCSSRMVDAIDKLNNPLEIKEILECFTTDVIGSCAFGLECNSFDDHESEFRTYSRKVFASSVTAMLRAISWLTVPKVAKFFGVHFVDPEVTTFFMDVVKKTVAYREENEVVRNDFMQTLIELKNGTTHANNQTDPNLTIEEIAAQAFIFFLAGFETSSSAITFCLFKLSRHADIQEQLRNEIVDVVGKHGGELTYEAMAELKYMSQVIDETLRLYPSVPIVNRVCTTDYKLPDSEAILEKGTKVYLPVFGIHRDPEFYPQPEVFDPRRFSEENKALRHPFTFIPFGEGPRNCIGMRFGLMQVKVGLALLLEKYKFSLNGATELPLTFETNSLLMAVRQRILLDAEKISTDV